MLHGIWARLYTASTTTLGRALLQIRHLALLELFEAVGALSAAVLAINKPYGLQTFEFCRGVRFVETLSTPVRMLHFLDLSLQSANLVLLPLYDGCHVLDFLMHLC